LVPQGQSFFMDRLSKAAAAIIAHLVGMDLHKTNSLK